MMKVSRPNRYRSRFTIMTLAEALVKRPGKITVIFIIALWAFTILVVIDTKRRFTASVDGDRHGDCPCRDQPARPDTPQVEKEEKVQTRTVVKWLNYCRKEQHADGTQIKPVSRSKAKLRGMKKTYINPHPYTFIMKNADACVKGANPNGYVDALLLVHTAPGDSYARSLIRKTWASVKNVKGKRIVTMFLLGQRDEETQYLLELEDNHYHDVIQENFLDSYYNLTLKSLMGLKWASQYCPNARYIMKVDVDMFINVYNLADRLDTAPTRNFAEGYLKPVTKPIRERQSKWYTSKDVYPNETYPRYFVGSAYLMSGDLSARIFGTSVNVPFLPWEDAFVGIVMHKIHVDLHHDERFEKYLNYNNDQESLRTISEGITFHLGEDKDENKDNFVMIWNRVRLLNGIPVLE